MGKGTRNQTTEQTAEQNPRIYVACLAAYNNGYLHGAWIDAAQEPWAIYDAVRDMLRASPIEGAEEWAIHDYEGFGGIRIEEYASLADYVQELTEETTEIPHALRYYIDYAAMARDAELSGDLFTVSTAWDAVHVFAGC